MLGDISELTVEWLNVVLDAHDNPVTRFVIRRSGQSNVSTFHHLHVAYAHDGAHLPRNLFLKLVRVDYPEFFGKELTFYRKIAPFVKARHPAFNVLDCRAGAYDPVSGRAYLLFEDVSATHANYAESEPHRTDYEHIVDGLAMLHAACWGLGEKWETPHTADSLSRMLQTAQEKFAGLRAAHSLDARWSRIFEQATAQWDAQRYHQMLSGDGMTIVHRDTHPNNVLYPREKSLRPLMIDWDAWRIDHGTVDLAYMMAFHWPAEKRTAHERALLEHYHARLQEYGVQNYAWEACLQDYRRSILRCLLFMLGAWRPEREPGDPWWRIVERGIQAYD